MRVVHGPGPGGGPWTGVQCYAYTLNLVKDSFKIEIEYACQ